MGDSMSALIGCLSAGDIYWLDVVSLLHFDGADNSTIIIDNAGPTWSATGAAVLKTGQEKFGPASLLPGGGSGDYVSTTTSGEMTGDFTVECFVYLNGSSSNGWVSRLGSETSGRLNLMISGTQMSANLYGQGNVPILSASIPIGAWHYLAFVRLGTTLTGYLDGIAGTPTTYSGTLGNTGGIFVGGSLNSYIDELRITRGVARYTANFTPPTQAFPNG